jgi:large subunit ribosomal protein L12e
VARTAAAGAAGLLMLRAATACTRRILAMPAVGPCARQRHRTAWYLRGFGRLTALVPHSQRRGTRRAHRPRLSIRFTAITTTSTPPPFLCLPVQSPKKVGEDIQKATMSWKGLKITVKLTVVNRVASVEVVDSASALVVKALGEPERDRKKGPKNVKHNGNLTLKQIFDIARQMRVKSMARTFAGTVKEILGTANSVGCTVDGKSPREVQRQIDDDEIEVPSA